MYNILSNENSPTVTAKNKYGIEKQKTMTQSKVGFQMTYTNDSKKFISKDDQSVEQIGSRIGSGMRNSQSAQRGGNRRIFNPVDLTLSDSPTINQSPLPQKLMNKGGQLQQKLYKDQMQVVDNMMRKSQPMKNKHELVIQNQALIPAGNIVLPGVQIDRDYTNTYNSFYNETAGAGGASAGLQNIKNNYSQQMFSQQALNASDYLKQIKREEENQENQLVRIRKVNEIFGMDERLKMQLQAQVLARQTYQDFGVVDAKLLMKQFVERKGSIGQARKIQAKIQINKNLPNNEILEKVIKDSYKIYKKGSGSLSFMNGSQNNINTTTQGDVQYQDNLYKFDLQGSIQGTQSVPLNDSTFQYHQKKDSIMTSTNDEQVVYHQLYTNESNKNSQLFYKTPHQFEGSKLEGNNFQDAFLKSIIQNKIKNHIRSSQLSPRGNGILYSLKKTNFAYDMMIANSTQKKNFLFEKQQPQSQLLQNQTSQILITDNQEVDQSSNNKILSKGFNINTKIFNKGRRIMQHKRTQSTINKISNDESIPKFVLGQTPIKSIALNSSFSGKNPPSVYTPGHHNRASSTFQKDSQMQRTSQTVEKLRQIRRQNQNNSTMQSSDIYMKPKLQIISSFDQEKRNSSLPQTHQRKPSILGYKIPDLQQSHYSSQDKQGQIENERKRDERQVSSIERKLLEITKESNPTTTTKIQRVTNADDHYYNYIDRRVEEMNRISKHHLPQRQQQLLLF